MSVGRPAVPATRLAAVLLAAALFALTLALLVPSSAFAVPANDNLAAAPYLASSPTYGNSTGATGEGIADDNGSSVWFKWTAPSEGGVAVFGSHGTGFDTQMFIYEGLDPATWTRVIPADNLSAEATRVMFPVKPGANYVILLQGVGGATGAYSITFTTGATRTVRGTVLDKDSAVVDGSYVLAYTQVGSAWMPVTSAWTDVNGDYEVTVTPGAYRLQFNDGSGTLMSQFYDGVYTLGEASNVDVSSGNITDKSGTLNPFPHITGRILDSSGSPGLQFQAQAKVWDPASRSWEWVDSYGGADPMTGFYDLVLSRPGTYTVGFVDGDHWMQEQWWNRQVEQSDAAALNVGLTDIGGINATLAPYPQIKGHIAGTGGDPSSYWAEAYYYDDGDGDFYDGDAPGTWTELGIVSSVDSSGNYTLGSVESPLKPGQYKVRFVDGSGVCAPQFYRGKTDNIASADTISIGLDTIRGIDATLTGAKPRTVLSGVPSGWATANVSFSLSVVDTDAPTGLRSYYRLTPPSGVPGAVRTSATGTATGTVTTEGTTTLEYWSSDAFGNVETTVAVPIRVDKTKPTINGAATTAPNTAGWYNSNVTVHFTATDACSGIATPPADVVITTEGPTRSATGVVTDRAGNVATATVSGIKLDATPPTTTCNALATYQSSARISLGPADTYSGVASTFWSLDGVDATGTTVSTSAIGSHTLDFASVDKAGNRETTKTVNFSVTKPTFVSVTTKSSSSIAYGAKVAVAGKLLTPNSTGVAVPGVQVILQSSATGALYVDGPRATTTSLGTFSFTVAPSSKTYYRVRFAGTSEYYPYPSSNPIYLIPKVYLYSPVAPTTQSHLKSYTDYCNIKPLHTNGTYPVYLYKYLIVGRTLRSYGYVKAKAARLSSTTSKCSAAIKLSAGKWKLRAYAPADSGHAATWSSGYSSIITVK
jgi:hypothetical protein